MRRVTFILAFSALVVTATSVKAIGRLGIEKDLYAYPVYKASYAVSDKLTGDKKSAYEVRDGGVTKGSYSFVQPDGIVRTVNYIVTPLGGFQAQVVNKGISTHPSVGIGKGIGVVRPIYGVGGARNVPGGLGVAGVSSGIGNRQRVVG